MTVTDPEVYYGGVHKLKEMMPEILAYLMERGDIITDGKTCFFDGELKKWLIEQPIPEVVIEGIKSNSRS